MGIKAQATLQVALPMLKPTRLPSNHMWRPKSGRTQRLPEVCTHTEKRTPLGRRSLVIKRFDSSGLSSAVVVYMVRWYGAKLCFTACFALCGEAALVESVWLYST